MTFSLVSTGALNNVRPDKYQEPIGLASGSISLDMECPTMKQAGRAFRSKIPLRGTDTVWLSELLMNIVT